MTWPVVDFVSDRALLVLQDRPLIGLHRGLVDVLAVAGREERAVYLLTPPASRLTVPLRLALAAAGDRCRWVVGGPKQGYYDGMSGAVLDWRDGAFAGVAGGGAVGGETGHQPGDAALAAAFTGAAEPSGGQLWLSVSLLHERPPEAFGQAAEAVCDTFTGAPPAGWGTAEPVSEFWRPATLSELALRRLPRPTTIAIVGGGERSAAGTIEISPNPAGVSETVVLAVGYETQTPAAPPAGELRALAERLAGEHPLSSFFAIHQPGRHDLTWPARQAAPSAPLGLAAGPEALGQVDIDGALGLPGAHRIGADARPTVWYDLTGGWNDLARIAERLHAEPAGPPQ